MNSFLLFFEIDKVVTILKQPILKVKTRHGKQHLPLNLITLVIREVECDTCDGSHRRSETFLPVFAFE